MANSERLRYLDSLRGLAAVTVVASHFILAYGLPRSLEFLSSTPVHSLWHGNGAVSFFFVLSGFVLSLPYLNDPKKSTAFKWIPYVINRSFRIIPLLLFAIIASFFARKLLFHTYLTYPIQNGWIQWFWKEPLTPKRLLELVPQGWTLQIELPVSMLIPFVAVLVRQKTTWMLISLYLLVVTLSLNPYILDFALGIIVAMNMSVFTNIWKSWNYLFKFSLVMLGVWLYTSEFILQKTILSITNIVHFNLTAIGCAFILICIISSQKLQALLSLRPLVFVGKISYSIYLTHFIILLCFTPWLISNLNQLGLRDEYFSRLIPLLATISLTICFSLITYLMVERPCMAIGKKIL